MELLDIGMSLDLSLRRTKLASHDLFKKALKQPKAAQVNKLYYLFLYLLLSY